MEKIAKNLNIGSEKEIAFNIFLNELNEWWPKEYTWSQNKLKEISIDPKPGGLCTEIGPFGFRCDWGRVTELREGEFIKLKWQVGPHREPVPDPARASDIEVRFISTNSLVTTIEFEHYNFENYGNGALEYRDMMDTAQGWDYILKSFKQHCEK